MEEKVFVIFNTTNIGDVLVTNTLVQNIKLYFSESKVVFVCKSSVQDVAKYQEGVYDVITYDKEKLKSFSGFFNFIKKFPYKNPYAAFVTYSNERNLLISRLIGAKHIISHHKFPLWNTDEKYEMREYTHMKDKWGGLIEPLTNEHKNLPIRYMPPDVNNALTQNLETINNPVVLCCTSNFKSKDMKPEDTAELIRLLNDDGCTPVMTGTGIAARELATEVKKLGCFDFIDLVDCTSFIELAKVLKICGKCISVDTGTLHLANALQVPVVGIFYYWENDKWGSDPKLYPAKTLAGNDVKPIDIFNSYKELIAEN